MEKRTYFNREQKRPVALREAALKRFAPSEVAIIDASIEYLRDKSAAESTDISHREWGWQLTEENEDIPYAAAWLSPDALTQEEGAFAEEVV
jgi:hypothetical protein